MKKKTRQFGTVLVWTAFIILVVTVNKMILFVLGSSIVAFSLACYTLPQTCDNIAYIMRWVGVYLLILMGGIAAYVFHNFVAKNSKYYQGKKQ